MYIKIYYKSILGTFLFCTNDLTKQISTCIVLFIVNNKLQRVTCFNLIKLIFQRDAEELTNSFIYYIWE